MLSEEVQGSVVICGEEAEGHPESVMGREEGKTDWSAHSNTHRFKKLSAGGRREKRMSIWHSTVYMKKYIYITGNTQKDID